MLFENKKNEFVPRMKQLTKEQIPREKNRFFIGNILKRNEKKDKKFMNFDRRPIQYKEVNGEVQIIQGDRRGLKTFQLPE